MWQLRQKLDREVYQPAQKTNSNPRKANDINSANNRTPMRRSLRKIVDQSSCRVGSKGCFSTSGLLPLSFECESPAEPLGLFLESFCMLFFLLVHAQ